MKASCQFLFRGRAVRISKSILERKKKKLSEDKRILRKPKDFTHQNVVAYRSVIAQQETSKWSKMMRKRPH